MSSRTRAQAHAKHAHFCSCGAFVHGNGAKWAHADMHERAGDGHRYVSRSRFGELFPGYGELPFPERAQRKVEGPRVDEDAHG